MNYIKDILTIQRQYLNDILSNPIFNNYFPSVGEKTQAKTKFSKKHFSDYLMQNNENSFVITPTDNAEISLIISSLSNNKTTEPKSIPRNNLKLLKNEPFFPSS